MSDKASVAVQMPGLKSIPVLGEVGLLTASCGSARFKGRRDLTSRSPNVAGDLCRCSASKSELQPVVM